MRTVKSPAPLAGGHRAEEDIEVEQRDPTALPRHRQNSPAIADDLRLLAAMTGQVTKLRGIDREPTGWALDFIARRLREIALQLEAGHE